SPVRRHRELPRPLARHRSVQNTADFSTCQAPRPDSPGALGPREPESPVLVAEGEELSGGLGEELARVRVPDEGTIVPAGGRDESPLIAEVDPRDLRGVPLESEKDLSALHVPDVDLVVGAADRDALPIGMPVDGPDYVGMEQPRDQGARGQVVDRDDIQVGAAACSGQSASGAVKG